MVNGMFWKIVRFKPKVGNRSNLYAGVISRGKHGTLVKIFGRPGIYRAFNFELL